MGLKYPETCVVNRCAIVWALLMRRRAQAEQCWHNPQGPWGFQNGTRALASADSPRLPELPRGVGLSSDSLQPGSDFSRAAEAPDGIFFRCEAVGSALGGVCCWCGRLHELGWAFWVACCSFSTSTAASPALSRCGEACFPETS